MILKNWKRSWIPILIFLWYPSFLFSAGSDNHDGRVIVSYGVTNGILAIRPESKTREIPEDHNAVFQYIWNILPENYQGTITRFELFVNDKNQDASDAYFSLNDDNKTWFIAVNYHNAESAILKNNKAELRNLDFKLIHEFAHILSLNASQMAGPGKKPSDTFVADKGTTRPDSFLNLFYQKFWNGKHFGQADEDKSGKDSGAFFESYPDEFVTDYAAAGPIEDFAETFAVFVTGDKPSGNEVKTQKILFFYLYPELVQMRDDLRFHLGSLK